MAMNRVDVVELVVDLDVDLIDVYLAVSFCDGSRSVLFSCGLVAEFFLILPELFKQLKMSFDAIDQIAVGFSERFRIIHLNKVSS